MNAEVERLFEAALEIPPEQRAQFLSQQCADAEVRREVELLLEHDRGAETFLAQAVAGEAASVDSESLVFARPTRRSVPYSLRRRTRRHGTRLSGGTRRRQVRSARGHQGGSGRTRRSFADRLQQECRILASLEHPNIARLLDAGATDDGCLTSSWST
jgi:eukaryotic-like serine/threonine-protein kinase